VYIVIASTCGTRLVKQHQFVAMSSGKPCYMLPVSTYNDGVFPVIFIQFNSTSLRCI